MISMVREADGHLNRGAPLYLRLLVGWCLVGVYRASHEWMYARINGRPLGIADLMVSHLLISVSWATLTWVLFRNTYRVSFVRIESWRTLFQIFVPTCLTVATASVFGSYLAYQIPVTTRGAPFERFFIHEFHPALLDAFIVLGIACAIRIRDEASENAVNSARLEAQFAHAQMLVLRSQMQPHFLFNALNSISSMIRRAPEKAESMILHLSSLLRLSIESSTDPEVPLSTEIDFARRYVTIQQIRFADRLRVTWSIDADAMDVVVPAFLLQPLVENSVKHGLAHAEGGGLIRIHASRRGDRLVLSVVDNGPATSSDPNVLAEGIGIRNTRTRMRQLYGDSAELRLERGIRNGMVVTVIIPIRE
jgi:two-component system LytT family sensor kinase